MKKYAGLWVAIAVGVVIGIAAPSPFWKLALIAVVIGAAAGLYDAR